jgi:hypothetical protein
LLEEAFSKEMLSSKEQSSDLWGIFEQIFETFKVNAIGHKLIVHEV